MRILDLSISKYFDSLKKYQKEHLTQGKRILVISKDQQGRPISKETTKTAQKDLRLLRSNVRLAASGTDIIY